MTRSDVWEDLVKWGESYKGFECNVTWKPVEGAGRGLVATSSKKAEEALLVVPAKALLNPLTLLAAPSNTIPAHLFPQASRSHTTKKRRTSRGQDPPQVSALNTTQLLTLHLALTRDPLHRHRSDWEVYLRSIPASFRPWHPLTWAVEPHAPKHARVKSKGKGKADDDWKAWNMLLELVPPPARENVLRIKERFDDDYEVLHRFLSQEEPFKTQKLAEVLTIDDILWAWLNVNTRSVSLNLGFTGPTELYNHTLVPVLDLVNHSSTPSKCIPKPRQIPTPGTTVPRLRPTPTNPTPHLVPGKTAFTLVAPDGGMKEDEELRFEYHGHCNTELWAEYGFCERPPKSGWQGMRFSMVDVGWIVRNLWNDGGSDEKREALKAIGCWDQDILLAHPEHEASHGLLMKLRVLYLDANSTNKLKPISQATITYVSEENEAEVNASIRHICEHVLSAAEKAEKILKEVDVGKPDWSDAVASVSLLWDEQKDIAGCCLSAYPLTPPLDK